MATYTDLEREVGISILQDIKMKVKVKVNKALWMAVMY